MTHGRRPHGHAGATLDGDSGEAVASRIGAGEDKIQVWRRPLAAGLHPSLKQAR